MIFEEAQLLAVGSGNRHGAAAVHLIASVDPHQKIAAWQHQLHHLIASVHQSLCRNLHVLLSEPFMTLVHPGWSQQGQMRRRNLSPFLLLLLFPHGRGLPVCHIGNYTLKPVLHNVFRRGNVCLKNMTGIEVLSCLSQGCGFQKQLSLPKLL